MVAMCLVLHLTFYNAKSNIVSIFSGSLMVNGLIDQDYEGIAD